MSHDRRISVIGLGYVGLPVAVAFARVGHVVAFDIDAQRIAELRAGRDRTREVTPDALHGLDVHFTDDPDDLRHADFHIVAVPTPIDAHRRPDLTAVRAATLLVGGRLKAGDIVVYESTVYPGVTEEICGVILEEVSGLRAGQDFHLGYSPERINPGDTEHSFTRITKVVAAQDQAALEVVAEVYGGVVEAGVFRAASIRTAEAAKAIENTQRDLNIALVNELSMFFHRLGLDTHDVLAAARTKWNFLPFTPGLVGGHCIGVDPYYLTHKAEEIGFHPQVILAGRQINDRMAAFVAQAMRDLLAADGARGPLQVTVLGLTFKEDVPDLRNSGVAEVVRLLEAESIAVQVHDPVAEPEDATREYGLRLTPHQHLAPADGVVLAVAHADYRRGGWELIQGLLKEGRGAVVDVKGILDRDAVPEGCRHWRL